MTNLKITEKGRGDERVRDGEEKKRDGEKEKKRMAIFFQVQDDLCRAGAFS